MLLHCFGCSLHWWDRMVPLLAKRHRVIRIDLLGFGGSEKPKSGYSMEEQGRLVALALGKLRVQGAVVVGHSMGFDVATALAAESSELVDRLVDIDDAPDPSFGDLPFTGQARPSRPVIGQALRRIAPDFAIEDGYESAFAPGYDLGDFSDQIVDDYRAMTYTSYDRSPAESDDYGDELPLDQRVRTAAVPLLVIFGEEDQLYDDPGAAAQAYGDVPGARITILPDVGHSPNVEKPGGDLPPRSRLRGARRAASRSLPYCQLPRFRPLEQMVHPAEAVGHAVLARGGGRAGRGPRRAPCRTASSSTGPSSTDGGLGHLAGLPVRSPDRPRNHVLQAAERRPALAGGLVEPKAVVGVDGLPAPGAAVSHPASEGRGISSFPWRRSG